MGNQYNPDEPDTYLAYFDINNLYANGLMLIIFAWLTD